MIVTRDEVLAKDMVGHMILHCIAGFGDFDFTTAIADKGECEVSLTIDGREADLRSFVDSWEKQIDKVVAEKACELLADKFGEIEDAFYGLRDVIDEVSLKIRNMFDISN